MGGNGAHLVKLNTTHGLNETSIHTIWRGMRQRCNNPKNHAYQGYGGRGIRVCERWVNSFEDFLSDMGRRPDQMSLDRIDVNGNYEPANCRWASRGVQNTNRRSTRFIEAFGEIKCLRHWANDRRCLISETTLRERIRHGETAETAMQRKAS